MRDSLLLEAFGDSPKMRIIDFFMDFKPFDFSKTEIIRETGLSKPTFYKYWNNIVKFEIVKETRRFGNTVLYELNKDNEIVKRLIQIEDHLIDKFVESQDQQERVILKPLTA